MASFSTSTKAKTWLHKTRGWGANNSSAVSHPLIPALLILFWSTTASPARTPELGGLGGLLQKGAPSTVSDTQGNGQVDPWEEKTGRGSCRAPDSAIKSQQGPCFIPGKRCMDRSATPYTLAPLATTRLSCWDTHQCQDLYFSLPTPAHAVNITLALSASLQLFQGQVQSSSLSLSKSLGIPSRFGPGP